MIADDARFTPPRCKKHTAYDDTRLTPHRCKKHTAYNDTRLTPHRCKKHAASFARSTGKFPSLNSCLLFCKAHITKKCVPRSPPCLMSQLLRAGYHPERDLVLILDTARFKYPPHWVPLSMLHTAMQRHDKDTGSYTEIFLQ